MKVVIAEAVRCQLVEYRHLTRATKRTWLSEADIIEQNDDHVWRTLRRFHFEAWRRLSITNVKFGDSWRLRLWHRENTPIYLLRVRGKW